MGPDRKWPLSRDTPPLTVEQLFKLAEDPTLRY
jgi:hypothetical protein